MISFRTQNEFRFAQAGSRVALGRWVVLALLIPIAAQGCATTGYLAMRKIPRNPLAEALNMGKGNTVKPSERAMQVLRRYDLEKGLKGEPRALLADLQKEIAKEPSPEGVYALGELGYIFGKQAEKRHQERAALDLYGASVAQAYDYLFDPRYDIARNPYDPQFRRACDLYNGALEGVLRTVRDQGKLLPGYSYAARNGDQRIQIDIVARGRWRPNEFERIEFASDYEVQNLASTHRTYGLGVPLVAVRKRGEASDPVEYFLPPGVSYAATAFLRVCPREEGGVAQVSTASGDGSPTKRCTLELFDTVATSDITVANRVVPLETDLTTPLAYYLNSPLLRNVDFATIGLLSPEKTLAAKGLYMLEPYDPTKIPVLMVHGLWSSPLTWVEMFNDLRSIPELRSNYQFWFYLYPSGQPFWLSAAQMREDLARVRTTLDPERRHLAQDQMVLVGHSMGGLVSRMQAIESGNEFWNLVSEHPFEELKASDELKEKLRQSFFFSPNPSVRRVVTIATPHHGSDFANDTTRYLARKLIALPGMMTHFTKAAADKNPPGFFKNRDLLAVNTSIDSLDPDSPVFDVMLQAKRAPWVTYHNIVALVANEGLVGRFAAGSDGVVTYASAQAEDAVSEKVVTSDHVAVHRTPAAVLEMRRILREHLHQSIAEWRSAHPENIQAGDTRSEGVAPLDTEPPYPEGIEFTERPAPSIQFR